MSIETEIKKLTAAVTQLTDAVALLDIKRVTDAVAPVSDANIKPYPQNKQVDPFEEHVEAHPTPAAVPTPAVGITFEDLNKALGEKAIQLGPDGGAKVRQIMSEYGAMVVSQIPPEKYTEVMQKVEALT